MQKYMFVKYFNFHFQISWGISYYCLSKNLNMGEGAKIEDKERGKGEVSGQWPIIDHIVPSNCKTLPTSAIQVSCFFGISSRRKEYNLILPLGGGWCFPFFFSKNIPIQLRNLFSWPTFSTLEPSGKVQVKLKSSGYLENSWKLRLKIFVAVFCCLQHLTVLCEIVNQLFG